MNDPKSNSLVADTDRPLNDPAEDELGFVPMAEKLAPAVIAALGKDGMVIGIEGVWGSGKTTLANYLLAEVQRQTENTIEVIRLSPWLSGDSDTLVGSLLQAMAAAIERRQTPGRWSHCLRWFKKKQRAPLTQLLLGYAIKTARTASPLLKAGDAVLPGLRWVGSITEAGANAFGDPKKSLTTVALKAKISAQLSKIDCRFIVLLDDLDRLEPSMAVEVVRLVRSVADFPKVLYLMCYDRAVLAHALESGLHVEDGYRFLRKIVQQTFSIPLPEPFDLRLTLIDRAINFFENFQGRKSTTAENIDIRDAINEWGESLRTPRDVKLVLNGIAFAYPPIAANVCYPDLCRLHIIKITHPEVYEWLETYLSEYSVVATGDGHIGRYERVALGQELQRLFPDTDDVQSPRSSWRIQQIIPGVELFGGVAEDERLFRQVSEQTLARFVSTKRLGSPYHYRYYFALSGPRTVLSDTDIDSLLVAAEAGPAATHEALTALYDRPRRQGGNWLSQLLDRFNTPFPESLSSRQLDSFLHGIADLMDYVLTRERLGSLFRRTLADSARMTIGHLYRAWRIREPHSADENFLDVLNTTQAINWLVGYFFRREMFDHGLVVPARAIEERDWLIPREVFERAFPLVQQRATQYAEETGLDQFPDLPSFVFGWRELVGNDTVRDWVTRRTQEDGNFVDFLLSMRSWAVSDHVFRPLAARSLIDLMNVADLRPRLEAIRADGTNTTRQQRANDALDALALGARND